MHRPASANLAARANLVAPPPPTRPCAGVCFLAGAASSFLATVITHKIRDNEAGLHCGSLVCIAASEKKPDIESTLGHVGLSEQDEATVVTVQKEPASANAMPPGR